jgi:hypothetical protein
LHKLKIPFLSIPNIAFAKNIRGRIWINKLAFFSDKKSKIG